MSEPSTPRTDAGYPNPSDLLVNAAELHQILRREADLPEGAPRTRVLDVRWSLAEPNGHAGFVAAHIPGAVYVDLESELSASGPATLGRHPLPSAADFTESARSWGLNPGDSVVAYDADGNLSAARLWWMLRDAGLERVRLLDGALPAWINANLPLATGDFTPARGTITLSSGHMPALKLEAIAHFAEEAVLLDARAPERYVGAVEPIDPQAGHIPGALNLPTAGNLDDRGYFLPTALLRERFAKVGALGDTPVGIYCGSGVTASHALFALALAGGEGALYAGSWSQWSHHPELPVATGPTP